MINTTENISMDYGQFMRSLSDKEYLELLDFFPKGVWSDWYTQCTNYVKIHYPNITITR